MQNIILIGFMGVGKGSIAREVVAQSNMIAIDTDDIIESMQNMRVKKIFETYGEAHFRALEARVAQWLEMSVSHTLISTGGGFYKQENLKRIGIVVLLEAPFERIYERILAHPNAEKKLKKRPLFQDKKRAKALYDERYNDYHRVADVVVDVSEKELRLCAQEIIQLSKSV